MLNVPGVLVVSRVSVKLALLALIICFWLKCATAAGFRCTSPFRSKQSEISVQPSPFRGTPTGRWGLSVSCCSLLLISLTVLRCSTSGNPSTAKRSLPSGGHAFPRLLRTAVPWACRALSASPALVTDSMSSLGQVPGLSLRFGPLLTEDTTINGPSLSSAFSRPTLWSVSKIARPRDRVAFPPSMSALICRYMSVRQWCAGRVSVHGGVTRALCVS